MHQMKKITFAVMTLACTSWLFAEAQDVANSQQQAGVSQFKETSGLEFTKLFDLQDGWSHIAMNNAATLYVFGGQLLHEWSGPGNWQKKVIDLGDTREVMGVASLGGTLFVSVDNVGQLDRVLVRNYKGEIKTFSSYLFCKPQALAKSSEYIFMADSSGRILRKKASSSNDKYDTPEIT
ncbi:MAG TPA: hypothetical protein VIT23_15925, partial [Terrimicrobiaceae bacterium]